MHNICIVDQYFIQEKWIDCYKRLLACFMDYFR